MVAPPSSNPCVRGFTLIELLVVVAIIGILSALGMAAWPRVFASVDRAKTASNFRQAFLGIQNYAGDNNGEIIPSQSSEWAKRYGWSGKMEWMAILTTGGYVEESFGKDNWQGFQVMELTRFWKGQGAPIKGSLRSMALNSQIGPGADPENLPNRIQRFQGLEKAGETMLLTEGQLQPNRDWFWIAHANNIRWLNNQQQGWDPEKYLDGKRYVLYANGNLQQIPHADFPIGGWTDRLFWEGYEE